MTSLRSPGSAATTGCLEAVEHLKSGNTSPMARWLHAHLFEHVLPFWTRHAIDERGGLCTCINDRGEILTTDKWLWSQWRAVWVFSHIYRQLDPQPRWLELARQIAEFCLRFGWDASAEGWVLVLARDGKILRGPESIYTDAFAIYGLVELYRACGDAAFLQPARRTADAMLPRLRERYDQLPHFPYSIPAGAKPHGIPMIWSLTFAELGAATGDERYLDAAAALSREIFRDFHRPARNALVEFVRFDGTELPAPQGTVIVPGHVIESMWFQFRIAKLTGRSIAPETELFRLMLRHFELGWDAANGGGIRLAVDAEQREPVGWAFASAKLWWPHTEALYGALLGWQRTRDPAFHQWYERLWRVCLERFVDWENGEWRQKLNHAFAPIHDTIALPVKDPFHLPRSLILQLELLGRILNVPTATL
jgi:N-acylglucosamine 2-epimerase